MKNIIWRAKISHIGRYATQSLGEQRLILFSFQAPESITDYCVVHEQGVLTQPLAVGQFLELFDTTYAISAIGDVASRNLKQLGHITLLFDGATEPELPGTVHLRGKAPNELAEQGEITIFERSEINHYCQSDVRIDAMKPIAIGADDAAWELRSVITGYLDSLNIPWVDYSSDKNRDNEYYPDVAHTVAMSIKAEKHERGILICGTGIGMSIVANKVPGIRAAQCHDTFSAERARKSNNAQIITLGARVIGPELSKQIIHAWLNAEYEGGNSAPKVERIDYYQNQHLTD